LIKSRDIKIATKAVSKRIMFTKPDALSKMIILLNPVQLELYKKRTTTRVITTPAKAIRPFIFFFAFGIAKSINKIKNVKKRRTSSGMIGLKSAKL
jgi:hypothetical protein